MQIFLIVIWFWFLGVSLGSKSDVIENAWITDLSTEGGCMQQACSYESGQRRSHPSLLFLCVATTDRIIQDFAEGLCPAEDEEKDQQLYGNFWCKSQILFLTCSLQAVAKFRSCSNLSICFVCHGLQISTWMCENNTLSL